ncbi:Integrase zinc binding domain [Popillia japonica]|uniref:RNA-directed DNA polymerase n=1 Tax=Popillia japonica TaxID=7064 RepID=A0AAW1HF60_POPJA
MIIKLMNYDIELRYLPGKHMYIADLLSRNYENIGVEDEIDLVGTVHTINRFKEESNKKLDIKGETEKDLILKTVSEYHLHGWPKNISKLNGDLSFYNVIRNELELENGILYYLNRIIIPSTLRNKLLQLLHEGHMGVYKTKLRAKQTVYWPRMMKEGNRTTRRKV